VVHDAANPFIVELNNMEVEDLGTSFMISAYPGTLRIKKGLYKKRKVPFLLAFQKIFKNLTSLVFPCFVTFCY